MTALFSPYHTPLSTSDGTNLLCTTILGGGIARSVTRIIIGRYKAFQRCLRASLEGFVMFVGSMTKVVKAIPRIGSMTNVIKVNIYGNQEVKRLTMR